MSLETERARMLWPALGLSAPLRYAIALVAVGLAVALRLGLDRLFDFRPPFSTFYLPIVLTAPLGGFGPGMVATLLSAAAADYFWLPPRGSLAIAEPGDAVALVLFIVTGWVITVLSAAWRRGERERQRAQDRFQLAVEAAPTAMFLVDRQGVVVYANALAEPLLGYPRDELVGRSIDELVPPRLRGRHAEYRASFAVESSRRPMGAGRDLFALRRDGSEVPVEVGLSPIRTDEGVLVLAAVTDITERQRAEAQVEALLESEQQTRQELERANRWKDEFLALVSHDLRTPLNATLGWVNLLGTGSLSPSQTAEAIAAIERNARAEAQLVESLLDLSSIVAGKLRLHLESLDLVAVVRWEAENPRPAAEEKGVALAMGLPGSPLATRGDAARLQQVVWNLLSNALKFTPRGGRVEVSLAKSDSQATISVHDSGRGIHPELLPHLFERFMQASDVAASPGTGRGLGLNIVKELVEAHGGTVAVASPGELGGATFTVVLPLATSA